MAKETDSRCSVCDASVGAGVRFCSRFCKMTASNDKLLAKNKNKHKANKAKHKTKPKRKKKSKKKT